MLAVGLASPGAMADIAPPSGRDFVIRNSTIDSGGGSGAGGDFAIAGTIGQPDAAIMTGDDYTLRGGFWTFKAASDRIFRSGFE